MSLKCPCFGQSFSIQILFSFSRVLDYPPGEESYLTLNTAREFLKNPSLFIKDELSFSSRINASVSLSEVLLAIVSYSTALSILSVAKIASILISIITLLLFSRILAKLKVRSEIYFLSMLFFVISPSFVYLISTTSKNLFPLFLAVLAFYFYINGSYKSLSFILLKEKSSIFGFTSTIE